MPHGIHHSVPCHAGRIASIAPLYPLRLYVRACQLHPLGSQRLVSPHASSPVPSPSSRGIMARISSPVLHLLSVTPGARHISHHILLHGFHGSLALSLQAFSILADDHPPLPRLPPPPHSRRVPPHPLRHRLHLRQGRKIPAQRQQAPHLSCQPTPYNIMWQIIKFKVQISKFKVSKKCQ